MKLHHSSVHDFYEDKDLSSEDCWTAEGEVFTAEGETYTFNEVQI